ncbi:unnamed protein product [Schistosoma mattheei]|uniref:Uncharacterized protein n=1 Tax=Schistosoma mattheei TaxID=31246 RepID=A0A183PEY4_9TREM|nr:unnamed protein product [Schistosoma mattheei]
MQLDDPNFADDLALLPQTQQQIQEKTTSVAAASAASGHNIHKRKSKFLRYDTACINPIIINGEDLEDAKPFTYLGSIIDEHGGSDADVKARIAKARAVYLQLKNICNSKQLSTNTKKSNKLRHKTSTHIKSCRPKEKRKTKEHITPGNGDRNEKNEQQLDGIEKVQVRVGWRVLIGGLCSIRSTRPKFLRRAIRMDFKSSNLRKQ